MFYRSLRAVRLSFTLLGCFAFVSFLIGQTATPVLPDQKIDIGGRKLRAQIGGDGLPVVVFEAGLGDGVNGWTKIQPEIAKFAKTVSYDRAGRYDSDPTDTPRHSEQIADDLRAMLRAGKIAPPYILVGHSAGGFHIRVFAHKYPNEIAGLVFVDPSNEDFMEWNQQQQSAEDRKKREDQIAAYPASLQAEFSGFKTSIEQVKKAWPLPKAPAIILTSGKGFGALEAQQQYWVKTHKEFAAKLPNAKHIMTDKSGHYIQREEPELVIDAIKQVIEQVKRK